MSNRTVRLVVHERLEDERFWRARSTYESGSEADTVVDSVDDVWKHAADQGIRREDVVFRGNSFTEMSN